MALGWSIRSPTVPVRRLSRRLSQAVQRRMVGGQDTKVVHLEESHSPHEDRQAAEHKVSILGGIQDQLDKALSELG